MSLPTVTDLKIELNITSSDNDDELADKLDAAIELVEGLIGPVAEDTVTETHYGINSGVLVLRQMPVAGLTTVASRVGAATTPLTLTDYELDPATGIVRLANGSGFYGNFTVTYAVGRATVPASIRMAILIVAGHLWETQRGTSPSALALQQPDVDPTFAPGQGYAIPNRAKDLLAPYTRPVIA